MSVKKFHVAYITDDNYAMPTCVSIVSLLENKSPDVSYCIHIVLDNVSEKSKSHLKKINYPNCEVDILETDNVFYEEIKDKNLKEKYDTHVTPTALLKFNLPNIFKDIDTLLYIDGDTIINKDISEIFGVDISKFCVGAVFAHFSRYARSLMERIKYFNSGIMLFNLKKMREENITEKLIYFKKNAINYSIDNDAFCVVLKNKTLFLPIAYNLNTNDFMMSKFDEFVKNYFDNKYSDEHECIEDQKILHMVGKFKPWLYCLPWFSEIFTKYYKISPYKNEPLKLKSPFPAFKEQIENNAKKINALKEWRFPIEKITKNKRIVIYGAGEVGKYFWHFLQSTDYCKVVLWVDKNYQKINSEIGTPNLVCSPEDIKNFQDYDYILISISRESIVELTVSYLKSIGVLENKIITIL